MLDLEAWLLDLFACTPDGEFAGINDLHLKTRAGTTRRPMLAAEPTLPRKVRLYIKGAA
ncbi:hypothetical protein LZ686_18400 [Paracoccus sp. NFXS7]|uniref:hypothetical protein n=1 Tax=Paracoccus sp. NFXS7 TaxID=2908653 RepID=UPI0032DF0FBC